MRHVDLSADRVTFRRVRGRIVPIRVDALERTKQGAHGAIAPAATAAILGHGIAEGFALRKAGALTAKSLGKSFLTKAAGTSMLKVAALTVAFSAGYNLLFGARQKRVIEVAKESRKGKSRIFLASKPGFAPGHDIGEHSYLVVRDKTGKLTSYGGQIKNASNYGESGVHVVRNYRTDKIRRATNVYDITPGNSFKTESAIKRIHRVAERLRAQTKSHEYEYRTIPVRKGTYNSNSVTGTITRRAKLDFRYDPKKHNLPGFDRSIPNK